MSVDIADVISDGLERTVTRSGLVFVGLFYAVAILNRLLAADVVRSIIEDAAGPNPQFDPTQTTETLPPSLGLPPALATLVMLLLGLVSVVLTVAALRTFINDVTERVPTEYFTRRMGWVVLNVIAGGIVFSLAVGIGFLLLVVPGLFLLVALFFWTAFVVDEDVSFVEGFERSWNATSGQRLELFALGVIVVVLGAIINLVFGIPAALLPASVAFLFNQLGSTIGNVFTLAATAEAYKQLTGDADDAETTDEFSTGSL